MLTIITIINLLIKTLVRKDSASWRDLIHSRLPPTPPLLYPNGRVPSPPSGNGVALGAGSDPPPPPLLSFILTALGLEPSQLKQLLQILYDIIERLEPFLRLLGLHDFICKISNQLAAAFDVTSFSNAHA